MSDRYSHGYLLRCCISDSYVSAQHEVTKLFLAAFGETFCGKWFVYD
jgi:hypothetical protein